MRRSILICLALTLCSPAVASAQMVKFTTNLGDLRVRLLRADAPTTVDNFMGYVGRGDYNGTIIHRSDKDLGVLQGGSHKFGGGSTYTPIPTQAPIPLEYRVPNTRGTLAMARTNDVNSATSAFFFNTDDNSTSLGPSNGGGYAVFGRVVDNAGLQTLDAMAALRVIPKGPNNALPVVNYPAGDTPAADNHVNVTSISIEDATAPAVTVTVPAADQRFTQNQDVDSAFSCTDPGGVGVESCTGAAKVPTGAVGQQTFTVTGTDAGGNTATRRVTYFVDAAPATTPPGTTPPGQTPPDTTPAKTIAPLPALRGTPSTSRRGVVTVTLRCAAKTRCAGRVSLFTKRRGRRISVGAKNYAVNVGKTVKFKLSLNRDGKGMFRRGGRKLKVSMEFIPSGRSQATLKRSFTLREKK